jgi:serine/threonine protein phosphatase PrpC
MPGKHLSKLRFAARTDSGRVRAHNEDAFSVRSDLGFVVVADGMGGYSAGEVASGIATSVLTEALEERLRDPKALRSKDSRQLHRLMVDCIEHTSASIFEAARLEPGYQGMGTTLVAALFHDNGVSIAHVGDSRAYRLRGGNLEQLTRDHSFLQEQIDAGLITVEQARNSQDRNLVTRAMGVDAEVEVEVHRHGVLTGDLFLLCSDGLTEMLSDRRIAAELTRATDDLDLVCQALIDAANERGGLDNISVALVAVDAYGESAPSPGWLSKLARRLGLR